MKNRILQFLMIQILTLILLAYIPAVGATKRTKKKKRPVSSQPLFTPQKAKSESTGLFQVFLGYSLADRFEFQTNSLQGTYASTGSLNLSARYLHRVTPHFLASLALGYEFERTMGTLTTGASTQNLNPKATASFLVAETNLHYRIQRWLVFAGGNYNFPTFSPLSGSTKVQGAVGIQGGLGYVFHRKFMAEALYRSINFSGQTTTGETVNSYRLWGFLIRGGVSF